MKKTTIKAWAVIRMQDMDIADRIFVSRKEAYKYRNDTLRMFLKQWPTSDNKRTQKVFTEFMRRYSVKQVEIKVL